MWCRVCRVVCGVRCVVCVCGVVCVCVCVVCVCTRVIVLGVQHGARTDTRTDRAFVVNVIVRQVKFHYQLVKLQGVC